MPAQKKLLVIRIVLFLGMIISFSLTSLKNFQKYIDGKSSIAESDYKLDHLEPLPTISICSDPSFDADYMKSLNVSPNLFLLTSLYSSIADQYGFPANLSGDLNSTQSLLHYWKKSAIAPNLIAISNDFIVNEVPR